MADVDRIVRAQRALLAPASSGDGDEWLAGVTEAVRELLGCDHTLFLFPDDPAADRPALPEGALDVRTLDTDPSVGRAFAEAFAGTWGGRTNWTDDLLTTAWAVRRRQGAGAYHERDLTPREVVERSEFYQEALRPHGLRHTMGIGVPLPDGSEYTLAAYFEGPDAPEFSAAGLDALRLLVPAFEAAARTRARLIAEVHARLAALTTVIDALPPAAVFDEGGRLFHRNPALDALLSSESEPRLGAAIVAWGRYLTQLHGGTSDHPAPPPQRVRTARGTVRVGGTLLGPELLGDGRGGAGALVVAEPAGPVLPDQGSLRERFGLTPREAEVALLLAHGLTDREVAERLCIAHSTVRRHVERVLPKLGVSSRAAVALRLLGDPACP